VLVSERGLPPGECGARITDSWPVPTSMPVMERNGIHIWRMSLNASPSAIQRLELVLSADERARAGRFHRALDRHRYMLARAQLRTLLGRYLDYPARTLRFDYSANGKPELPSIAAGDHVRFNISHAGQLALCAVSRATALGVDVEADHPQLDVHAIARRYFGERELARLRPLPSLEARDWFLQQWTRKEALAKAQGVGMWQMIGRELLADDGAFKSTGSVGPSAAVVSGAWYVYDLDLAPSYRGAIACEGPAELIAQYSWPLGWSLGE
jgi:4'-phosphopantetheinyl transferase